MGVINTGSFAKALFPGVNTWYGDTYKQFETEYNQIFDNVNSTKAYEEYVGFSGFGLAQKKPEGSSIAYDSAQQGFITRLTNVAYALGFVITKEMYDDDQYGIIGKRRANALAFSMRQTVENVCANVLNRAFNSSYTGGDGVSLINASHPNKAGGTWSNQIGVASDLSEAALEQACIDIAGFTNDRGLKISVMPRKLIISKEQMFDAQRILKSIQQSGNNNNDINALRAMNMFPEGIAVNHYLTSPTTWFVKTNCGQAAGEGLIYQERQAASFSVSDDSDTMNAKYMSYMRFSAGWSDPRSLYGSAGP